MAPSAIITGRGRLSNGYRLWLAPAILRIGVSQELLPPVADDISAVQVALPVMFLGFGSDPVGQNVHQRALTLPTAFSLVISRVFEEATAPAVSCSASS